MFPATTLFRFLSRRLGGRAGGRPDNRRDAARALPLLPPRSRPGAAGEPFHGTRRRLQGRRPRARPRAGAGGGAERGDAGTARRERSEEHTSELQSLLRISYAVFCLKKKK